MANSGRYVKDKTAGRFMKRKYSAFGRNERAELASFFPPLAGKNRRERSECVCVCVCVCVWKVGENTG